MEEKLIGIKRVLYDYLILLKTELNLDKITKNEYCDRVKKAINGYTDNLIKIYKDENMS